MGKCDNGKDMWEAVALSLLSEAVEVRKALGRFPESAPFTELMNSAKVEILEALRRLYRKDKVTYHETVNGIPMFGVREEDEA